MNQEREDGADDGAHDANTGRGVVVVREGRRRRRRRRRRRVRARVHRLRGAVRDAFELRVDPGHGRHPRDATGDGGGLGGRARAERGGLGDLR